MATLREVRDTFETLVSENGTVIRKLEETAMDARSKRLEAEDGYKEQLSQVMLSFFLPPDVQALKSLGVSTGFDFNGQYSERVRSGAEAQRDFVSLTADYGGSVDGIKDKIESFERTLGTINKKKDVLGKAIKSREDDLKPVVDFNKWARAEGSKTLEEGNFDYFDSRKGLSHVVAMVFDGHYRKGRGLIKKFRKSGTTITAAEKMLADDRRQYDEASDNGEKTQRVIEKMNTTYKSVQVISARIESEDSIITDLSGKAIKMLDDPSVFNRSVLALNEKMPVSVVEVRAKIEGFKKIERGMQLRANSLRKASGQLERQLPKIRKGVRRNGSRKVSVDLDKVKKTFRAVQKSNAHTAGEMRKASASIGGYSSGGRAQRGPQSTGSGSVVYGADPIGFYMDMMILDMLIHDHHHGDAATNAPDAQSVHSVIGLSDGVTQDANIDMNDLSPDVSCNDAVDGLSGDFNDSSCLDVGSLGGDIPDVDVGGFSGSDFGGGGGADFGGFDF